MTGILEVTKVFQITIIMMAIILSFLVQVLIKGKSWSKGDWAIYLNNEWRKLPSSNSKFKSFNGRSGNVVSQNSDYKISDLDFSNASINVIGNVNYDPQSITDGEVLKFSNGRWTNKEDSTGINSSITTNQITDGTIDSNHFVANTFHIDMFSNASLETDLLINKNNIVNIEGSLKLWSKRSK